jgi:prepilin-type N-terminal cleavage/methylation domain-containing protein
MQRDKNRRQRRQTQGFTLVELLIVISILGLLVGLLAWGLNAARIDILMRAQRAEISSIASAIEAYRNKYSDYPPDGSSWRITESHLRKVFPNILQSELDLLNPMKREVNDYIRNDNTLSWGNQLSRVFDPAEALVFFLGGFSSDPSRPITGAGGPLKEDPTTAGKWVYNTQRENAFFEFRTERLTLRPNGLASNDETLYDEGVQDDLMPVYVGVGASIKRGGVPLVYFDSRTYFNIEIGTDNFYSPTNLRIPDGRYADTVRPFLSDESIILVEGQEVASYANKSTFQILSAGFDNLYGCQPPEHPNGASLPTLFSVPSGKTFKSVTGQALRVTDTLGYVPYQFVYPNGVKNNPVHDNVSNIVDSPTFGDSL